MEITEIRIKLMEEPGERLRAFCSITLDDCFVIRDLKIIEGANGLFVAMPSRKLSARCSHCGTKNHTRAFYCNHCGQRQKAPQASRDDEGRPKLYADIAHPINTACREMLQEKLIAAFQEEVRKSQLPGYVPSYFDFEDEGEIDLPDPRTAAAKSDAPPAARNERFEVHGPHKVRAPRMATALPEKRTPAEAPRDAFGAGIL